MKPRTDLRQPGHLDLVAAGDLHEVGVLAAGDLHEVGVLAAADVLDLLLHRGSCVDGRGGWMWKMRRAKLRPREGGEG